MKGFITMSMVVTIVIIILVAAAMFAYWKTVEEARPASL